MSVRLNDEEISKATLVGNLPRGGSIGLSRWDPGNWIRARKFELRQPSWQNPYGDYWHRLSSGHRLHAVGELPANAWGLHDLRGNVWEWTLGGWSADFFQQFKDQPAINPLQPFAENSWRVLRGGSWLNLPTTHRDSLRFVNAPENRGANVGFRVVLPVEVVRKAVRAD